MASRLIILGLTGNASDILDIVDAINRVAPAWEVLGILDDSSARGAEVYGVRVLGKLDEGPRIAADAKAGGEIRFVNAIGSDTSYMTRAEVIRKSGIVSARFATLMHPQAAVSARAEIGVGSYLCAGATVAGAVKIGAHVHVGAGCQIGHDSVIEEYAMIAPAAAIGGHVRIGRAAYIGAAASIRQRLNIGAGALVGMGAVVVRDVHAGITVVGNPARALARGPQAAVIDGVAGEFLKSRLRTGMKEPT